MMNQATIVLLIIGAFLKPLCLSAQIDEEMMQKDLRVAAKVLETLIQDDDHLMMYNDNIAGDYIDGYGVMFTIGGGYSIFKKKDSTASDQGSTEKVARDKKMDAYDPTDDFEKILIEFLVDYSQTINQLQPTDKIFISTKKSDYMYAANNPASTEKNEGHGITVEMLKKDHNDYVSGKIARNALVSRIKINKHNGSAIRAKDLDLFASMLKTIYDDDYTDSYFISWDPEYERIEGIGAIYSFKVYSSYDENGSFNMPGIDRKGLTAAERNAEVIRLYPIFVKGIKENLLQYGRTINSLGENEMVLLRITLTKCDSCELPKKIQLAVKQSVLREYNTGVLTLDEAVASVKVTEL